MEFNTATPVTVPILSIVPPVLTDPMQFFVLSLHHIATALFVAAFAGIPAIVNGFASAFVGMDMSASNVYNLAFRVTLAELIVSVICGLVGVQVASLYAS